MKMQDGRLTRNKTFIYVHQYKGMTTLLFGKYALLMNGHYSMLAWQVKFDTMDF